MIMIHGRGASPESILSLTNEIKHRKEITFYAPEKLMVLHGIHTRF